MRLVEGGGLPLCGSSPRGTEPALRCHCAHLAHGTRTQPRQQVGVLPMAWPRHGCPVAVVRRAAVGKGGRGRCPHSGAGEYERSCWESGEVDRVTVSVCRSCTAPCRAGRAGRASENLAGRSLCVQDRDDPLLRHPSQHSGRRRREAPRPTCLRPVPSAVDLFERRPPVAPVPSVR